MTITDKYKKPLKRTNESGFTLIEAAIAITLLALVIAPLFTFIGHQAMRKDIIKDEKNNERVLAALAEYVKREGRYPKPAEWDNDDPLDGCFPGGAGVNPDFLYGTLPAAELRIPFQVAQNADGFAFRYAVSCDATRFGEVAVCGPDPCIRVPDGAGGFDNYPMSAAQATAVGPTNNPALNAIDIQIDIMQPGNPSPTMVNSIDTTFVIINPGSDNRPLNGCVGANEDTENCDNDNEFSDMPRSVSVGPNDPNWFDDTVMYSLAREQSTMWMANQDGDIINRNTGRVVICDPSVAGACADDGEQLRVEGAVRAVDGSVRAGANVDADGNVIAGGDVTATTGNVTAAEDVIANDNVIARGQARSPSFFYD